VLAGKHASRVIQAKPHHMEKQRYTTWSKRCAGPTFVLFFLVRMLDLLTTLTAFRIPSLSTTSYTRAKPPCANQRRVHSSVCNIQAIFTALVGPSCLSKAAARISIQTSEVQTPSLYVQPASAPCHTQHPHRTTSPPSTSPPRSMTVNGTVRITHLPQKPDPLERRPPFPIPYESRWTRRPLLLLL
jgi:hypothetical protein